MLTGWSAIILAAAATIGLAGPAQASTPMYIGSVAGGIQELEKGTGESLSDHAYTEFGSTVPEARMITVQTPASWKQVANAAPGSALYDDIVRWARTLKSRGPVMVAYHHEPEASGNGTYGTASDFIAAYRRVVTIFRQQGATNVQWVLQLTAYAYRVPASDPRAAVHWYPGDAYVDNIGGDAYNWYTCGHGNGKWTELKDLADPVLAFAHAHGKAASLPEFASYTDARRATWVRNAHQYFVANRNILTAEFYFNRPPTVAANKACVWPLKTSAEYQAFGDIARDRTYFATT